MNVVKRHVGVVAEWIRSPTQALVFLFRKVWVRITVVTLVSLSKTLYYNCVSPAKAQWVPVRAEMVVNDLASFD